MSDIRKEHKIVFGKEPVIIGMYWNDPKQLEKNIKEAIKNKKPYNEYEMLTKEEQKLFDEGMLFF